MNIPEIFLSELWEIRWFSCAVAVGLSIGVLVRFVSFVSNGCLTFFNRTESFPELSAFTKDDQQRLLRDASLEAFSALSFVPILVGPAFLLGGFALALTLQKVTALPAWGAAVLTGLFFGLGWWLARRLEARRVRPFLKKLIDGQNGKTVA